MFRVKMSSPESERLIKAVATLEVCDRLKDEADRDLIDAKAKLEVAQCEYAEAVDDFRKSIRGEVPDVRSKRRVPGPARQLGSKGAGQGKAPQGAQQPNAVEELGIRESRMWR